MGNGFKFDVNLCRLTVYSLQYFVWSNETISDRIFLFSFDSFLNRTLVVEYLRRLLQFILITSHVPPLLVCDIRQTHQTTGCIQIEAQNLKKHTSQVPNKKIWQLQSSPGKKKLLYQVDKNNIFLHLLYLN